MDPLVRLVIIFALLAIPSIFFVRARLHYRSIPALEIGTSTPADPDCMVVIPARDEEANIARAVRSFPVDTVIVVDDASSDATAEEARKAGAGVLTAPPLPRRALGKASACQAGADILTSRWILFVDADTWYEPRFLAAAVALADARQLNFLSVVLAPQPHGFAEHLLAPYLHALFFAGVNPRTHPTAVFCGQCIFARRESYQFLGGHKNVQQSLCDDVRLAALALRHRMNFGVLRGGRMGHMRFHQDGIWEGVRRNAFRFNETGMSMGFAVLATALLAAMWLPLAGFLWWSSQPAAAVVVMLIPLAWLAGWYRSWRVVLGPVAIYAALPLVIAGALTSVTHANVEWKGRMI